MTTTKPDKLPFSWQDKRVLRKIRENCEEAASALSTYFALTVIASDLQKEEFQTTHKWIAAISGFCEKTVRKRLEDLERIEAVHVTTPPMKAPCTYRLLPFGNGCRTSGNGCRAFGNRFSAALPTSEVIEEMKSCKGPRTVSERIGLEGKLRILRSRLKSLEGETSEAWQRQANPGLVCEKKSLIAEIESVENALLK